MVSPEQLPESVRAATKVNSASAGLQGGWSVGRRIGFRFIFSYFVLFIAPFPLTLFQGLTSSQMFRKPVASPLVQWVGKHVFHLTQELDSAINGSGDRIYDYVQLFCTVALAGLLTVIWSIADRRSKKHEQLLALLRIYVRYCLACVMISYGMSKVFRLQFPPVATLRLLQTYGESSPMGLLWTFFGYSGPYTRFAGLLELIPGILLFFRRTTSLGALLLMAALGNVVLANFCYDVPVKIYSANLLLMAVFLIAPMVRGLINLLILNRPTIPPNDPSLPAFRWMKPLGTVAKVVIIGAALFINTKKSIRLLNERELMQKSRIYGAYEVEETIANGQSTAPAAMRWRNVSIGPKALRVRLDDNSVQSFTVMHDEVKRTFTASGSGKTLSVAYTDRDKNLLTLEGSFMGRPLNARLRKLDPLKFPLLNRGFHWINEAPYNR